MTHSPFDRAKALASEGNFREACELLFGPSPMLFDDNVFGNYAFHKNHWQQQGKRIMNLSDLYRLMDRLTTEQLESLRRDMRSRWLFTSLLEFEDVLLSCDGRDSMVCPYYKGISVTEVSERVLQYVFGTRDSKDAIISKLCRFSGKDRPMNVRFWTPSLDSRCSTPRRAASLYFSLDQFCIDSGGNLYLVGRSRGVLSNEAD